MWAILIIFAPTNPKQVKYMKLFRIFPLIAALLLGTSLITACGDDDELDPQDKGEGQKVYKEVVGTYTGWTHLTTNFINKNYEGDTFTLALSDEGMLIATFKNNTWGTATITGIKATKIESGEGYILQEGEGSFVMNNPRDNTTQEFGCKLSHAAISADKKQMTAVIIANMTTAGAHGEMIFTFQTGNPPAEE